MEFAHITYNKAEQRYELRIDGRLKGYTQGEHEKGLQEMISLVKEKGYEVIVEE